MTDSTEKAAGFMHDLGEAARQNPVSAALIGMGVLWLFAGNARRVGNAGLSVASDALSSGGTALRSKFGSVADGAMDFAGSVGDGVNRAKSASGEFADSATGFVPDSASEAFGNARSNLATLFEQQPLLLGAVGIAIGAGIAASFPSTDLEAEFLGERSDELKDRAQDFVSEQTDRAKTVAQAAANAAAEEARRQGLDPSGLKSAAGGLADKIKSVTGATSDSVRQRVNQP